MPRRGRNYKGLRLGRRGPARYDSSYRGKGHGVHPYGKVPGLLREAGGDGERLRELVATGKYDLEERFYGRGYVEGSSLLHMADSASVTRVLVELGADVNAKDDEQLTPLHAALEDDECDVTRVLVELGADVNARDDNQETPLHRAFGWRGYLDRMESVRVLVELGADVNAKDSKQRTPLHFAAKDCDVEAVRALLEFGADVNAKDLDLRTPLHIHFFADHALDDDIMQVARVLVEFGADVNAKDSDQRTSVHMLAGWGGHENSGMGMQVLVEFGADVNAKDSNQRTPLHIAAECHAEESMQVLVEFSADVNAKDSNQRTPLHSAAKYGSAAALRILLEHDAIADLRDGDGNTARDLVLDAQHTQKKSTKLLEVFDKFAEERTARPDEGPALAALLPRVVRSSSVSDGLPALVGETSAALDFTAGVTSGGGHGRQNTVHKMVAVLFEGQERFSKCQRDIEEKISTNRGEDSAPSDLEKLVGQRDAARDLLRQAADAVLEKLQVAKIRADEEDARRHLDTLQAAMKESSNDKLGDAADSEGGGGGKEESDADDNGGGKKPEVRLLTIRWRLRRNSRPPSGLCKYFMPRSSKAYKKQMQL